MNVNSLDITLMVTVKCIGFFHCDNKKRVRDWWREKWPFSAGKTCAKPRINALQVPVKGVCIDGGLLRSCYRSSRMCLPFPSWVSLYLLGFLSQGKPEDCACLPLKPLKNTLFTECQTPNSSLIIKHNKNKKKVGPCRSYHPIYESSALSLSVPANLCPPSQGPPVLPAFCFLFTSSPFPCNFTTFNYVCLWNLEGCLACIESRATGSFGLALLLGAVTMLLP